MKRSNEYNLKKILLIAYTDVSKDPRPRRQIQILSRSYDVVTIATAPHGVESLFFQLEKLSFYQQLLRLPLLLFRFYNLFYWDKFKCDLVKRLNGIEIDLIIVHEIRLVPLALRIRSDVPILLDAHEYSPHNFNDNLLWRLFFKNYYTFLTHTYLPDCKKIITVSRGVGDLYKKNFGVEPIIITNAADYQNLSPTPVDPENIKIVHHGDCSPSRKLELMIEMMDFLPQNYTLYLILVVTKVNKIYFNKLKKLSQNRKVIFLDPLPFDQIIPYCNRYDFGITFHPPTNVNILNGLGNKFFEFIQSRLVIAVGPLPEMKNLVDQYGIGVVSSDFSPQAMAKAIAALSIKDIEAKKEVVHSSAKVLSSEKNGLIFLGIIEELLNSENG